MAVNITCINKSGGHHADPHPAISHLWWKNEATGETSKSTRLEVRTGYVLDFVAKTPVPEIHLLDRDVFLNHIAFRCPGATSLDDLGKKQMKVDYLTSIYSRMRKRVIPHN